METPKVYKVFCVNCRAYLYNYRGDFRGPVVPRHFHARPGVPQPAPGEPLMCPECRKPWYMMNSRTGSIIVMTDVGWKPQAPQGKQPRGACGTIPSMVPETPQEFKGDAPEYLDPLERARRAKRKNEHGK